MKDPAFLFYSNDFLSGTMLMSNEDVGAYIRLLCLQHQKGHLKEKDMLIICGNKNEDILNKFTVDENGNYYNERLEEEIIKRKKYSESRRNNRLKKKEEKTHEKDMQNICNSYEEHMENENENENINNTKNKKKDLKEKEKKIQYAEFVSMTEEEYQKLLTKYGEDATKKCIETLDNYKGSSGKKYKSDYRAILTWVIDKVKPQVRNDTAERVKEALYGRR